jgi:type I restriction enzyme S subunit
MSFKNEVELKYVADYGTAKIEADILNSSNYISTDNLIPEKGGKVNSDYLPIKGKVSKYSKGDTLVSNIRPYFKKILFAKEIGGCSNDVIVFKPKLDKIEPQYLYYQLSKDDFFDFMMAGANGTKMPRGNKKSIPTYKILLHPLPTQRRIASILSAYDDLIENNLKRIKLLEEIAQRTYEEWFVKFRVNGEQLPMDENTGLPVGWEYKKLEEVASIIMGQSPKSEFYNKEKKGLPFHQGVTDYGFRYPENSTWSTEGNRYAEKGDILFSVRAPVGRLNVAIEKIVLGRGLSAIRHKKNFNDALLYQLQKIFIKDDMMGGGAIFNSVTKSDVERIMVIEAKIYILNKFNQIALTINNQIENLTKQNQKLKESRDILLPRLMNGTINVE